MKYLDEYAIKARLYPVAITMLPLVSIVVSWQSNELASMKTFIATVMSFGGGILLTQLGRDAGKSRQNLLFEKWGGKPTTLMLRYSGTNTEEFVDRLHLNISAVIPDIALPTKDDELCDKNRADRMYDVAVNAIIERTRDNSKYTLLFRENCNYGFRRNLWGLKKLGITISSLGSMAVAIMFFYTLYNSQLQNIDVIHVSSLALNLLLLYIWISTVSTNWVKTVADAYAYRLLGTTEVLADNMKES